MKLEAAIKSALEFENRIRDLYIEAVSRTDEPTGKKIFQTLADDEQRHVDYLESRLDEWQKRGEISNEVLASVVPDKAAIRKEAAALQSTISEDARGLKQQMLSQALAMEIETSRFYKDMVEYADKLVGKLIRIILADTEVEKAGHRDCDNGRTKKLRNVDTARQ